MLAGIPAEHAEFLQFGAELDVELEQRARDSQLCRASLARRPASRGGDQNIEFIGGLGSQQRLLHDRSRRLAVLRVGDLELDTVSRTVIRAGRPVPLQRREFLLLEQLVRHAGQVVTRSMLLEAAWDYDFEARGNIVDMHIHRLRQKVDEGFPCRLIHTVPGAGYILRESDEPPLRPEPST